MNKSTKPVDHAWLKNDDYQVVLSVGRLEPVKNHHLLIEAFSRVHKIDPSTRLIILGEGSLRNDLQSQVESLGLDDVVDLPGYVENPYKFMRKADVYIQSSRREGLPSVLIESLAVGCPIVATNCPGGTSEILSDGRYGNLVPPDEPITLSEEILSTLNRDIDRNLLIKRARDYSIENVLDQYEELIFDLLNTPTS